VFRSIWIGLLISLLVVSCNKDPYELGVDLVPPTDTLYVGVIDTITVEAYSELEDSIRTDELSALVLGSVLDPVFGKTTASFYTQCLITSEDVNFGTNPQLDSLVLMLQYSSVYGDTNSLLQVRVFEVSEDLEIDSSYYSNQSAQTYGLELANITFLPRPHDSVSVFGVKQAPHLRINLSNQTKYLGNKILDAPEDVFSSYSEFIKFIKGLYVEAIPVNSRGAIINFEASDDLSKLVLYFHNDNQGDSLYFEMPINDYGARFNTYDHHGYLEASPDFKQQVLYNDTNLGKNQLFLQTMAGVKVRLRLPYIKDLKNLGSIAINNAVLTFTNPSSDTTWSPPSSLAIYKVDSTGKLGLLTDASESSSYFGGSYNTDDRTYWFRITRHIQRLLIYDTLTNYDLCVYAASPLIRSPFTNRVVLYGTDPFYSPSPGDQLHLHITYTKK